MAALYISDVWLLAFIFNLSRPTATKLWSPFPLPVAPTAEAYCGCTIAPHLPSLPCTMLPIIVPSLVFKTPFSPTVISSPATAACMLLVPCGTYPTLSVFFSLSLMTCWDIGSSANAPTGIKFTIRQVTMTMLKVFLSMTGLSTLLLIHRPINRTYPLTSSMAITCLSLLDFVSFMIFSGQKKNPVCASNRVSYLHA